MRRTLEESPYYDEAFFDAVGVGRDEVFDLVECVSCGLVFIGNPASDEVLGRLYAVPPDALPGHLEVFARPARLANQLQAYATLLVSLAERLECDERGVPATPVEILDFGAGIGAGLLSIARQGFPYRAYAVESAPAVIEYLAANGVLARPDLDGFGPSQRFDAVVLNDVLEHLKEPVVLLREIARRLKPHGLLWIAVPDFSGWRLNAELRAFRAGGPLNKEINPLEHLCYFSPTTLDRVSAAAGLRRFRHTTATIRIPRSGSRRGALRNVLRALRDVLRVQRQTDHRYTTAALFELDASVG